mmetsp:Transcript_52370/g.147490  ORF Transcript_52370/g.147490 Transcript_52370/m.147490 type:complete len:237 (-) Transcript_52370:556-1266(-)
MRRVASSTLTFSPSLSMASPPDSIHFRARRSRRDALFANLWTCAATCASASFESPVDFLRVPNVSSCLRRPSPSSSHCSPFSRSTTRLCQPRQPGEPGPRFESIATSSTSMTTQPPGRFSFSASDLRYMCPSPPGPTRSAMSSTASCWPSPTLMFTGGALWSSMGTSPYPGMIAMRSRLLAMQKHPSAIHLRTRQCTATASSSSALSFLPSFSTCSSCEKSPATSITSSIWRRCTM